MSASWLEATILLVVGWLMTWGAWVSRRAMDAVSKLEFEKHREARNVEMRDLIAKVSTKEDMRELREEITDLRNLLIKDLRGR